MLTFQTLGALEVTDNGEPVRIGGARQRRLVAMLLIHRNAVVSVDRLADAVFAGEPTAAANTTMRSYVARLRRIVQGEGSMASVVTRPPGYAMHVGDQAFDVGRFERLVRDAGGPHGLDAPERASAVLREALGLWHGDAYAEFAEEDWARPEAERLEELRLVALERLFDAELACGRAAQVLPDIETQVARHPLRERFRTQLVLALYRSGRHADALAVVADYRHVLADELGLDPSPALAQLEHRVLTHDPALASAATGETRLRGYRLGDRLGSGRDGTVHAASLPGVERELAVKIFRREIANSPRFIRSFESTAQAIASLHHSAIVPIHDYWREPDAGYLVMRRMTGGTLADRLQRGPLSAGDAAALLGRVGGALAVAAGRGIVHGRLCADSVIFDAAGDAYLTDFDLGQGPDRDDACDRSLDDVHDLAVLVRRLAPADADLAERVARGAAAGAPMSDVVSTLVAALDVGAAATVGSRPNPYKGLRAFDEDDAADFFGRADLVDALVGRLGRPDPTGRLVLVVGGSGTGKSSVVRAGLLPRLRRGGEVAGSQAWFVATMLPGSSPFRRLAESLRHVAVAETAGLADELADADGGIDRVLRRVLPAGGELLLVVDQLEELFTMAPERDHRGFLDGIIDAIAATDSRLRVVATLRADFFDRPLAVPRFGAAVNDATVTVPAMGAADLESAVVAPAERVGGGVERALVAELVNAVIDQPAALPSLQFTLYELAERSPDMRLTLSAYRQLGGVGHAIAARAESLYQSLPGEERAAVRRMFERLVVVGTEGGPTRRRTPRSELSGPGRGAVLNGVIDCWTQARLLTLDRDQQTREPTVEVAHEALLRAWPRLAEWIDADRDAILTLARLREAAAGWHELGRDPDALYRGARLEVALGVTERDANELSALERDFLDAGRERRDREAREAAERAERQARDNRRLRVQLVAIAIALIVAVVGGLVAVDRSRDADAQREVAAARGLAAAADASLADDPERSILLALAAVEQSRSTAETVQPDAEAALHRAVTASRVLQSFPGVGGQLDWSPDGALFVPEGPENSGMIDIRDAETGASVRSFRGHDVDLNQVAFSPDGSKLLSTGDDGAVRVWDPTTGSRLLDLDRGSGRVDFAAFSPDGTLLAVAWPDSVLQVVDIGTGRVTAEFAAPVTSVAFSPDGGRIAVGPVFGGPILTVFDVRSGAELYTSAETVSGSGGTDIEWSPDGRWIATAGGDNIVRIWDAASGDQRFAVTGHTAPVLALDWSPDSGRLVTASWDGTARVSEILDVGVRTLFTYSARDTRGGLGGVAFSPDGLRVMTGDVAMTSVKIWDASDTGAAEWVNVRGVPHGSFNRAAVDYVPGDGRLAVGQEDGTVTVTDVDTGDRVSSIGPVPSAQGDGDIGWLDVSADGELLATANWRGVDVWDTATGSRRFTTGPELKDDGWIEGTRWSAGGDLLAYADQGETSRVVIADRAGKAVATLVAPPGTYITDLDFGPDGLLATTTEGQNRLDPKMRNVTIWDVDREVPVRVLDAVAAGQVAYDPSGRWVATTNRVAGAAEIWDSATGALRATLSAPAPANAVAFSADGAAVATGHSDGTVRLWDPATGAQQLVLGGGPSVGHVVFGPDGDTLTSADDQGLVRVWALDLDDLVAIASSRLTRTLTTQECQQYPNIASCPTG